MFSTITQLSLILDIVCRSEKEKQTLILEIDGLSTQLDSSNKMAQHASAKAEALEDTVRRLKVQVDDFGRQNHDLNSLKARLTQENVDLQRQLHDLDSSNAGLSKARAQLQQQLDDAKSKLDDETRQRNQLTIQVNNLSVELDSVSIRLDEETDAASTLRLQLSNAVGDMQKYKSKYEKDLMAKQEELEDIK